MIVVLKLGGRVAAEAAEQVAALRASGAQVVVVHGAGPQITRELERRGVAATFVEGRRVTTPDVLAVVVASFDAVSRDVCATIGPDALPLRGDEIGLRARRVEALGLVGDPQPSAPPAVVDALAAGRVPVVAPLAEGPLNVNADEAAAALAIGLGAERIAFVSDVPGVLLDGVVAAELIAADVEARLAAGLFEGGIVPKLEAAVRAVRGGVPASIGETAIVERPPALSAAGSQPHPAASRSGAA